MSGTETRRTDVHFRLEKARVVTGLVDQPDDLGPLSGIRTHVVFSSAINLLLSVMVAWSSKLDTGIDFDGLSLLWRPEGGDIACVRLNRG